MLIGGMVARVAGRRLSVGVALGAGLAWSVARGVDERRWRASVVSRQVGDRGAAEELAARLATVGVEAEVTEMLVADSGEGPVMGFGVRYRQRVARAVEELVDRPAPGSRGGQ